MASNFGNGSIADESADCKSGNRMIGESIEEYPGARILNKYVSDDSRIESVHESLVGACLLHESGLRFSQGMKFVSLLADMTEERFKIEEKTAHILQDYSCDWIKKLANTSSEGNGDFYNGSILAILKKVLMESMEEAKIHNLVKNEGLGHDGPVLYLRSWLERMKRSHIKDNTVNLYTSAWEKQSSVQGEIKKAIEDIKTAQQRFEWFEENRMIHIAAGLQRYIDIIKKLDTERVNHKCVIKDITSLLDYRIIEGDSRNLEHQYSHHHQFPVFEEFVDTNADVKEEKATLHKMFIQRVRLDEQNGAIPNFITNRKSDTQFMASDVIISNYHDSELSQDVTLCDDYSTNSKKITVNDVTMQYNDIEKSDMDIYDIDDEGQEIRIMHEPNPCISDERKRAAPLVENFDLPNALESDSETDIEVVKRRNHESDIELYQRNLNAPLKFSSLVQLPQKAMNTGNKTSEVIIRKSEESMKQMKEIRKFNDKKQTTLNTEKVKEKVQEHNIRSCSKNETEVIDISEVRTLGNVKVIAVEDYVAQNTDELTLRAGQKLKQKVPANSDGMAFGWIWKGKLGRKIYGYYPANIVELRPKKDTPVIRDLLFKKSESLKFTS